MTADARHGAGSARSTARLASGEELGPYRLVEKLGEGGMGVVYRALDERDREVAVKVLRPHIAHDPDARDRLRREVSTLARVRHESVAPVLDADVDGDRPYIVTRYVPGPPLDDVIDEYGPLDPGQLVTLGRGLAEALRAIHAVDVVHRDLKPGNVLMVGDEPVLIDFGIAHVADDVRLTMTGLVMGTPGYLSPEVVEGAPVTEATDWWGWAATLAFAASGQAPFGRGPMTVVLDRVSRGKADLTGVDARLRPLLAAALSPVPAERPSADEVLAELQEYAAGGQTGEIPVGALGAAGLAAGAAGARSARSLEEHDEHDEDADRTPPAGVPMRGDHTRRTPVVPATQAQPLQRPDPTSRMPQSPPPRTGGATSSPASGAHPVAPPPVSSPTDRRPDPYATPSRSTTGSTPVSRPHSAPPPSRPAYPAPAGSQPQRWDAGHGGPGPVPGAQWQPSPDGRIGRPARTRTLAALLGGLVGLTALLPYVGLAVLLLWSIAARWVDKTMTAMVMRRFRSGPRRSDGTVAVLASPWHGLLALLSAVFSLLLPLLIGAGVALCTALALSLSSGGELDLFRPLPVAAGMVTTVVSLWWGPGGTSLRRGSRSVVRGALPHPVVTQVVVALCLVLLAVGLWTGLTTDELSWWPHTPPEFSPNDVVPGLPQG